MKAYKLTDRNMKTHNNTQWVLNEAKETSGKGYLCSPGWFHFYSHPLLAVLLNSLHANFNNPRLFEINAEGKIKKGNGLKFGCTKMTLVKELELPKVTLEQRVKFGILCALEVCNDDNFVKWAQNWLDGTDRSYDSANTAYYAAYYAANAAYDAAAYDAAAYYAANAAANAAYTAANAAAYAANAAANAAAATYYAEIAVYAADYAVKADYAADYADYAADAAADAAKAATINRAKNKKKQLDLIKIAKNTAK